LVSRLRAALHAAAAADAVLLLASWEGQRVCVETREGMQQQQQQKQKDVSNQLLRR
jgi:hypothetical protein